MYIFMHVLLRPRATKIPICDENMAALKKRVPWSTLLSPLQRDINGAS